MKEKTLVILAAGMGSRFGGLKQIEPVGPNGEFLIDYSIYSAIKYGFNKVVFVIKEENYEVFKETVGARVSNHVKVEYAFQKIDDIPEGFIVPEGRVKPWGTAHAIYAARDLVSDNFAVISADDFYGDAPFKLISEYLDNNNSYAIVGYKLGETLSESGAVKRGVIFVDEDKVVQVLESKVEKVDAMVYGVPLDKNKDEYYVEFDQPVSMLFYGFTPDIFNKIGSEMLSGFTKNKDNLDTYEMLLPDMMDEEIQDGKGIDVKSTTATWMGMTYKEDVEALKAFILKDIEAGTYPHDLWGNEKSL